MPPPCLPGRRPVFCQSFSALSRAMSREVLACLRGVPTRWLAGGRGRAGDPTRQQL